MRLIFAEPRRLLISVAILMLAFSSPGRRQNREDAREVFDASVGFPFRIISQTSSTVGPPTWFIFVRLSKDYYSRPNLEQIWHYISNRYSDKSWKLDLRLFVDRGNQTAGVPSQVPAGRQPEEGFVANFLRQGEGAMAGGGTNEILIYHPDLNKPTEISRIVLKGRDPFDPYAYTGNRDSDFVASAAKGDRSKFESLLAEGVGINARDRFHGTALLEASTSGYIDLVQILLQRGADVNARNQDGWTALMCSASGGHLEVVRLLLGKGAQVNARNNRGMSALTRAIYDDRVEIVKLLLARGADRDFKDKQGDTPLILAADRNPEIVRSLLEKEVEVDARNDAGETALMRAYHSEAIVALLNRGANVNAQDYKGNTVLMHAVKGYNPAKVRHLLSIGADVTIKTASGTTALAVARQSNQNEVIQMLREAGAKE